MPDYKIHMSLDRLAKLLQVPDGWEIKAVLMGFPLAEVRSMDLVIGRKIDSRSDINGRVGGSSP